MKDLFICLFNGSHFMDFIYIYIYQNLVELKYSVVLPATLGCPKWLIALPVALTQQCQNHQNC